MKKLPAFSAALILTASVYSQWIALPQLPITGSNNSVSVPSPNVVWYGGGQTGQPKIFRSTNAGNAFTEVTGNLSGNPEPYCIWAADENIAFVGDGGTPGGLGGNAKVWKTTNGGVNWNVILTTGGTSGFVNSIVFSRTSPLIGIIESDPPDGPGNAYWLAKTTDGGNNWTVFSAPGVTGQASTVNSLAVIDDLYFGFGLRDNTPAAIRWTSNGGTSWNISNLTGLTGGHMSGYAIKSDKTTIIAATGDAAGSSLPNIGRSPDGGIGWVGVNTGPGFNGYCTMKWVYGTNVCYISAFTASYGCIRKSTDGGLTWTTQTTASIQNLTHFDIVYSGGLVYGYGISQGGYLIKLVENPLGLDPNNTSVPVNYSLEQNFPNPFNPSTIIKYSLPKASYVTLKVYDMLGNEVMKVVDGQKSAGNYVEQIDASSLASGIYFYTLRAGDYAETKKMSFIK